MRHFISEQLWQSGESLFNTISPSHNQTILIKTLIRAEGSRSYIYYYYIQSKMTKSLRLVSKYDLHVKKPKFTYVVYLHPIEE